MIKDIISSFDVEESKNGKGKLFITKQYIIFEKYGEGITLAEELVYISHVSATKSKILGHWFLNLTILKNEKKINLQFKMTKIANAIAESDIRNAMMQYKIPKNVPRHKDIPLGIPDEYTYNDCWYDAQHDIYVSLNPEFIGNQCIPRNSKETSLYNLLEMDGVYKSASQVYFKHNFPCIQTTHYTGGYIQVILCTILDNQITQKMVREMFLDKTLYYTTESTRYKMESFTNLKIKISEIEYELLCKILNIEYRDMFTRTQDYTILSKYQNWNNTTFVNNNSRINEMVISSMHRGIKSQLLNFVCEKLSIIQKNVNLDNVNSEKSRIIEMYDFNSKKIALGYEYQHPRLFTDVKNMKLQLSHLYKYETSMSGLNIKLANMTKRQYLRHLIAQCCTLLINDKNIEKKCIEIINIGLEINVPRPIPLEIRLGEKYLASLDADITQT